MKALVLEEYKKLTVKQVEKPEIAPNEVLIRVKACAICGSDAHGYDGSSGRRIPPMIMGHEASGVIEEVGASVRGYGPGDKVVFNSTLYCGECYYCRRGLQSLCEHGKVFGVSTPDFYLPGAMAEYIAAPAHILYPMPDGVGFDEAALIEPMAIGLHAISKAQIDINDTVAVIGTGTIGIMIIKLLKLSSAGRIIAVDIDDEKLEFAKKCGADIVINSRTQDAAEEIRKITGGGADVTFEAVGIESTVVLALEALRKNGTCVLVGNMIATGNLPMQKIVTRELKVFGTFCCSNEYETCLKLIADGKMQVGDIINAAVPLEEGPEWFERLHRGEKGIFKIVLHP